MNKKSLYYSDFIEGWKRIEITGIADDLPASDIVHMKYFKTDDGFEDHLDDNKNLLEVGKFYDAVLVKNANWMIQVKSYGEVPAGHRDLMWDGWDRSLLHAGYVSLEPVDSYFSSDLTEAWIGTRMWIDIGWIVKVNDLTEEHKDQMKKSGQWVIIMGLKEINDYETVEDIQNAS